MWSRHPSLPFTLGTAAATLAQKSPEQFVTVSGELCIILCMLQKLLIFFPSIRTTTKITTIELFTPVLRAVSILGTLTGCTLCILQSKGQKKAHSNRVTVSTFSFSF